MRIHITSRERSNPLSPVCHFTLTDVHVGASLPAAAAAMLSRALAYRSQAQAALTSEVDLLAAEARALLASRRVAVTTRCRPACRHAASPGMPPTLCHILTAYGAHPHLVFVL